MKSSAKHKQAPAKVASCGSEALNSLQVYLLSVPLHSCMIDSQDLPEGVLSLDKSAGGGSSSFAAATPGKS